MVIFHKNYGKTITWFFRIIDYRVLALKVGGTNIGGNEYFTAVGTGFIGSQYYIGLYLNDL